MFVRKLKDSNFDFEKVMDSDIKDAIQILSDSTNGTFVSDNQKLGVLDNSIFDAIFSLFPNDPIVIKIDKEREEEYSEIVNDGWNTEISEEVFTINVINNPSTPVTAQLFPAFDEGGPLDPKMKPEALQRLRERLSIKKIYKPMVEGLIEKDALPIQLKVEREFYEEPQLTCLSFGGGQDSYAILYSMINDPTFRKKYAPKDLIVVMSDTGDEFDYTYNELKTAKKLCDANGIHFKFLTSGFRTEPINEIVGTEDMGYHTDGWKDLKSNMKRNSTILAAGMGVKACTGSLKIAVVDKYMHDYMCDLYGFPSELKAINGGKGKKGWELYHEKFKTKARVLIGFARDEEGRVTKSVKTQKDEKWQLNYKLDYIQYVFPLIEEGWNREEAQKVIKKYGNLMPPSNCMICFYQSDQELLWLYRNRRKEFDSWVELEHSKLESPKNKNITIYEIFFLDGKKKQPYKELKQGKDKAFRTKDIVVAELKLKELIEKGFNQPFIKTGIQKNIGVYENITLTQKIERVIEKYGHLTDADLMEYKMSHGHCVKSGY